MPHLQLTLSGTSALFKYLPLSQVFLEFSNEYMYADIWSSYYPLSFIDFNLGEVVTQPLWVTPNSNFCSWSLLKLLGLLDQTCQGQPSAKATTYSPPPPSSVPCSLNVLPTENFLLKQLFQFATDRVANNLGTYTMLPLESPRLVYWDVLLLDSSCLLLMSLPLRWFI